MGPVVGLALGAGAAKGLAHLGVLQVLEEAGVPVHLVAGSSIGSVFGALYAMGSDLKMLEKVASELKHGFLVDVCVPRCGLLKGGKVESFFRLITKEMTFDQLKIPLYAVAVDVEAGEKVVISEGSVAEALRASTAIPGIFQPKEWRGRKLVDGAVLDRVPVQVAKDKGAEMVIAVDVKFGGSNCIHKVNTIFEIILQSIELMDRELMKYRLEEADIVIRPDVSHISQAAFHRAAECIQIGREAALQSLPSIRERLDFLNQHKTAAEA
ncbi:MAG: patatin-like phospholipase family protein [Bacillota bacterium]